MIQECSVLLWVQHLKQSTGGVAVVPATNLVDFIDENKRVFSAYALQGLDDLARKCTTRESGMNNPITPADETLRTQRMSACDP